MPQRNERAESALEQAEKVYKDSLNHCNQQRREHQQLGDEMKKHREKKKRLQRELHEVEKREQDTIEAFEVLGKKLEALKSTVEANDADFRTAKTKFNENSFAFCGAQALAGKHGLPTYEIEEEVLDYDEMIDYLSGGAQDKETNEDPQRAGETREASRGVSRFRGGAQRLGVASDSEIVDFDNDNSARNSDTEEERGETASGRRYVTAPRPEEDQSVELTENVGKQGHDSGSRGKKLIVPNDASKLCSTKKSCPFYRAVTQIGRKMLFYSGELEDRQDA